MMMIAAIQALPCVADPSDVGIPPILGSGVAIIFGNHDCTLPIRRRELLIAILMTLQCSSANEIVHQLIDMVPYSRLLTD